MRTSSSAEPSLTSDAAPHSDEPIQLLAPDGRRMRSELYDPWITDVTGDQLASLYEDLVLVRRIDVEATALQRQGELGLWAPLLGQEAAQVGSARTLRPDDFVFSSYRENAVAYCRGVEPVDLLKLWRGTAGSGWDPFTVNMATPAIVIGAQALHAVGWAMGERMERGDAVAVTYFGDGATTQGDVSEAMVFAASFSAPVVFFCQNNQWAISEPVSLQSKQPIANRAGGFGIPAIRVDGNDVLAVMAATRCALDRARTGGGPTFIEAVTFRMGPHTTSDDPTRYVDPLLREEWAAKDPITRVEAHLRGLGLLTDELAGAVAARADQLAATLREGCLALADPPPLRMFDHVYAEPHRELERQRSQYAAYLDAYGTDTAAALEGRDS
jgi:2-oxoisovalerate dehydrogenase E1 component alpha subunit